MGGKFVLSILLLTVCLDVNIAWSVNDVSIEDCVGEKRDFKFPSVLPSDRTDRTYLYWKAEHHQHGVTDDWLYQRNLPERAINYCRQCMDSEVITDFQVLPSWIFVTYIGLFKYTNETEWKWANGSTADIEQFKSRIKNFNEFNNSLSWGILAETENKWHIKPFGEGTYEYGEPRALHIVCQTKEKRAECHRWNYTKGYCNFNEKFGCYQRKFEMWHNGEDNVTGVCQSMTLGRRGYASQCPAEKCTCTLTPWSEWSVCSSSRFPRCDEIGTRKQTRTTVGSCNFGDRYVRQRKEECQPLQGCEVLKNEDPNVE